MFHVDVDAIATAADVWTSSRPKLNARVQVSSVERSECCLGRLLRQARHHDARRV